MAVVLLIVAVLCLVGAVINAIEKQWLIAAALAVAGVLLWPGVVIVV